MKNNKKDIAIIAAVAANNAIGYQNKLLYHIKADMQRFRMLTTGNTVIMGRKTFESLPGGALPDRRNIVLSRSQHDYEGCETYPSLEEALKHCGDDEKVFIIGGASLYREALPIATKLFMTEIESTPDNADAFFPDYSEGWKMVKSEDHETLKTHRKYRFADYER